MVWLCCALLGGVGVWVGSGRKKLTAKMLIPAGARNRSGPPGAPFLASIPPRKHADSQNTNLESWMALGTRSASDYEAKLIARHQSPLQNTSANLWIRVGPQTGKPDAHHHHPLASSSHRQMEDHIRPTQHQKAEPRVQVGAGVCQCRQFPAASMHGCSPARSLKRSVGSGPR